MKMSKILFLFYFISMIHGDVKSYFFDLFCLRSKCFL
jgi:hypothetical protein